MSLRVKLARARLALNQFHPKTDMVEKMMRKTSMNHALGDYDHQGDTFITRNGHHIRDVDARGHEATIKPYLKTLGIKTTGQESVDDFITATGMIRSKFSYGSGAYQLHHPPSKEQRKTMQNSKYDADIGDENMYIESNHLAPNEQKLHRSLFGKQRLALQPVNKGIQTFHKVKIDPTQGAEIADAYDAAEHSPNDPGVISAYNALNKETGEQYDEMINNGLKITKLKEGEGGYATAQEMHDDILNNNHLSYFPSEQGFGQETGGDHPMLGASGRFDGENSMPNNDLFRIVHDVNGHVLGDLADFSPEGEHQAFLTHRQQYSPEAGKALFSETAGQANWGAFSREHGESNRRKILDGKHDELVFAEQKATILPDHIRNGDHHL